MVHEVFLGLGTNLGCREKNLRDALNKVRNHEKIFLERTSSIYETRPVGGPQGQPWFLNMVVQVKTYLKPHDLLRELKAIEKEMGRKPGVRFGPREIDLDILLFDSVTIKTDQLEIPHPRLKERAFVLVPLLEICPAARLPDGTLLKGVLEKLNPSLEDVVFYKGSPI
ncbi:MAG TPA: 2-amino-4-hydroxy-6-hydroxymethyldihydropteridine diphosphokinase [Peptococcaceae bacterium]|nr:MAG: 2-amino-4-hydroxy-6-hydroxymethyldihydropteridine pyrophosphokinase [Clostridia bacterium 41_269]HBT20661.1 2-amino-4-hydroxy-6-hydroxymethyldihydropteridine diphosphokinase [Peptococcaceae bacterium]